jgi:hypothetical protein
MVAALWRRRLTSRSIVQITSLVLHSDVAEIPGRRGAFLQKRRCVRGLPALGRLLGRMAARGRAWRGPLDSFAAAGLFVF